MERGWQTPHTEGSVLSRLLELLLLLLVIISLGLSYQLQEPHIYFQEKTEEATEQVWGWGVFYKESRIQGITILDAFSTELF